MAAAETNNIDVKKKPKVFRRMLNYSWVTDNTGFFLFLSILAVIYIGNGHLADKTIRKINKTEQEIEQLQNEYKTLKSEMMFKSREAELIKAAEPLGLQVTNETPKRIQAIKK